MGWEKRRTRERQDAKKAETYNGSEKDKKDGYIHFSEADQVPETLKKYYQKKEHLIMTFLIM